MKQNEEFQEARKWCGKEVQYSYYQQQMALFHGTMHTYSLAQLCWHSVLLAFGKQHENKDSICLVL